MIDKRKSKQKIAAQNPPASHAARHLGWACPFFRARTAEEVQKLPNGDLLCDLPLPDTANGQGYFAYRHLGILQGGTHVVVTYWNEGGSGVFEDLLFIRFVVQKFRGTDGAIHERHLMELVDSFNLGDRDSGEIRLMTDRVTVGPWKQRKAAVVLLEPQIVTAR